MKFQLLVLFCLISSILPSYSQDEKAVTDQLNKYFQGEREVKIEGGRIDILTNDYAIEVEKANNWKEAIGQSLWYALQKSKQAGIVIITKSSLEYRYIQMLSSTLDHINCDSKIKIWEYRVNEGILVLENAEEVFIGKPPIPQMAAPPENANLSHWITFSSNKRHNSNCTENYGMTKGKWCTAYEGIACKICGG